MNIEVYTFRLYWRVVLRQLENAKRNSTGSMNDIIAALAFSAFTLEAYLNFAGAKLLPDDWTKIERKDFHSKMRRIVQELGLPEPSREAEPFRTVIDIHELRNELAHGKAYLVEKSVDHDDTTDTSLPPEFSELFYQIPLYKRLLEGGLEGAEAATLRVADFMETLHEGLRLKLASSQFSQESALSGPLSDVRRDAKLLC